MKIISLQMSQVLTLNKRVKQIDPIKLFYSKIKDIYVLQTFPENKNSF